MATFTIVEYQRLASDEARTDLLPLPLEPPVAVQTVITLSSTSQQSAQFDPSTRLIEITTDAVTHILVGTNPTATTACTRLDPGLYYRAVKGGQKIAVRTP